MGNCSKTISVVKIPSINQKEQEKKEIIYINKKCKSIPILQPLVLNDLYKKRTRFFSSNDLPTLNEIDNEDPNLNSKINTLNSSANLIMTMKDIMEKNNNDSLKIKYK